MDFEPYFKKYEALVEQVNQLFDKVQEEYDACVACKVGCADCCHALFDLTLIEAMYIKSQFEKVIAKDVGEKILEKANTADRQVYKLKRAASKEFEEGKPETEILEEMASQRIRCPLLNDGDKCDLYESRPITCRLYGIPTVIGDRAHTCGMSGFKEGEKYPTVNMGAIQRRLYEISFELVQDIKSAYPKLGEMLVPLSMALLTKYNEEYLGLKAGKDEQQEGSS